jgi:hypothetical protein
MQRRDSEDIEMVEDGVPIDEEVEDPRRKDYTFRGRHVEMIAIGILNIGLIRY